MRFATKIVTTAAALVLATATVAQAAPYQSAGVIPTLTAVSITPAAPAAPAAHMVAAVLTQDPKVEVDIKTDDRGAWYTQPMWIAIGVIALVLIILLAVAAGRKDTTTVVK
ncbi:MAG: hypothetical protein WD773_11690 [Gemmatimonadales bacterium]